jgi:hypothetical protein
MEADSSWERVAPSNGHASVEAEGADTPVTQISDAAAHRAQLQLLCPAVHTGLADKVTQLNIIAAQDVAMPQQPSAASQIQQQPSQEQQPLAAAAAMVIDDTAITVDESAIMKAHEQLLAEDPRCGLHVIVPCRSKQHQSARVMHAHLLNAVTT